jgi:hypothetical protein
MKHRKERALFEDLKNNLVSDLQEYRGQYSVCDCYSEELSCEIELKVRDTHYDTLIIEKQKFDSIIRMAQEHNRRAIYINKTPKGVFAFDLGKIQSDRQLKWEVSQLPSTTYWNKKSKKKNVFYLPISWAIELTDKL